MFPEEKKTFRCLKITLLTGKLQWTSWIISAFFRYKKTKLLPNLINYTRKYFIKLRNKFSSLFFINFQKIYILTILSKAIYAEYLSVWHMYVNNLHDEYYINKKLSLLHIHLLNFHNRWFIGYISTTFKWSLYTRKHDNISNKSEIYINVSYNILVCWIKIYKNLIFIII